MKRNRSNLIRWCAALGVILVAGLVSLAADDEKNPFRPWDKAYYLSAKEAQFIRPGLVFELSNPVAAADGTLTVDIKYTDPKGAPLDRLGIETPGAVSTSFVIARIPRGETKYLSYITRTDGPSPTSGKTATQATGENNGTYVQKAPGVYTYTFRNRLPSGYDRTVTHTIHAYGNRNLTEFDLGVQLADTVVHFVPDGSSRPAPRDIVAQEACNRCHGSLSAHGTTGRQSVAGCITCHNPQTTDAGTGNNADFAVMVHKIHMGRDLPSVKAGTPYKWEANGNRIVDFSNIGFPTGPSEAVGTRACEVCHYDSSKPAAAGQEQRLSHVTRPSRDACGSCHDNVNFATGANHANVIQLNDTQCSRCHQVEGDLEFDVSIKGAHTIARSNGLPGGWFTKDLPGLRFAIASVRDTTPGSRPTVVFSVRDGRGATIPLAQVTRLAINLIERRGSDNARFWSEDPRATATCSTDGGACTYRFTQAIPAEATGTWTVEMEGYRNWTLLPGTTQARTVRDSGRNAVLEFAVTGALAKRRVAADYLKCNNCHLSLQFHGDNRNELSACVSCHNPTQTDAARRTQAQLPAEAINFKEMIHRIHLGEGNQRDYTIYGFGGNPSNFNKVALPGGEAQLSQCITCHVPGEFNLPTETDLLNTTDPRNPYFTSVPPQTGACLSCHQSKFAAAHAAVNTSDRFGEACLACHGVNSTYSPARVHAR